MKKALAIAALLSIVLLAGLYGAVHLFLPPEKVRSLVTERLSETLGVGVTMTEVKPSLIPVGVSVRNLEVANPAGEVDTPLAVLEEGTISVRILPLLSRRLEVSRAVLRGLDLSIVKDSSGNLLLAGAEPSPADVGEEGDREVSPPEGRSDERKPGADFALLLSAAELKDASVRIIDQATGSVQSVGNINVKTSIRISEGGAKLSAKGRASLRDIRAPEIAASGYEDGIEEVELHYDLEIYPEEESAKIQELVIRIGDLSVVLGGKVSGFTRPPSAEISLSTPDLELADLLSLAPAALAEGAKDFSGRGPLSLEGQFHLMPEMPPSFRMTLTLGGLNVKNERLPEKIENLRGKIEATERRLSMEDLSATVGGKPVLVSGYVTDYEDPKVDIRVRAEVDLAAFERAGLMPEKMSASGSIRLDLAAMGKVSEPERFELGGSVTATQVDIQIEEPPLAASDGAATIRMEGRELSLETITFDLNGSKVVMEGKISDPVGEGGFDLSVKTPSIDLTLLKDLVEIPPGQELAGVVSIDLRARGTARALERTIVTGSIRLEEGRATLPALAVPVRSITGAVRLTPEAIIAESLGAKAGRSALRIAACIDDPMGARTITFTARARMVDLDELLPGPEEGRGGGQDSGSGDRETGTPVGAVPVVPPIPDVTAQGTILADTLISAGNVLTGVKVKFQIRDGKASTDLQMSNGTFGPVRVRNARSDLTIADGSIEGTLAADSAVTAQVPLASARGRLSVSPGGLIEIKDVVADVYQGRLSGDAAVQLESTGQASYQFTIKATDLEANDLLSHLTPVKNMLFGKLTMESSWQGRGLTEEELLENLTAGGEAFTLDGELRNLEAINSVADFLGLPGLKEQKFRRMQSSFQVGNGRFSTEEVTLEGKTSFWKAAGSVGFDGSLDYDISVTLSKALSEKYRQKTRLADLFSNSQGQVVLDFKLTGNARKPKITYDPSKTASRAGVSAIGSLIKELDKDGKVQGVLDGLLGGKGEGKKGPSVRDLLRGLEQEKTPPDSAKGR